MKTSESTRYFGSGCVVRFAVVKKGENCPRSSDSDGISVMPGNRRFSGKTIFLFYFILLSFLFNWLLP